MKALILTLATLGLVGFAHAETTVGEKTAELGRDTGRAAKKGANRVKEMVCAEGDAKCLAKKAKHRAEEGGDYVSDKAKDVKDKVD